MLLKPDKYKRMVLDSLSFLVHKNKIQVYGFVIMPNHIHIIWEFLDLNGKEMPHASLFKYTSHIIQKDLKRHHPMVLERFRVNSESRDYQFWQSNSLSIELRSSKMIYQKLDYIHNNPCKGKWMLSNSPIGYPFSSASFYESGKDEFGFLIHIGTRL
jgi:putative transposase